MASRPNDFLLGQSHSELKDKINEIIAALPLDAATRSENGLMSAADKLKLDNLESGGGGGGSSATLTDLLGTEPIGDIFTPIYYNGTTFVPQPSFNFSTASWDTINYIAENGLAPQYFKVGDKKDITLTTGEIITVIIIGFDVDVRADNGSFAKITLGMENLLATKYKLGDNSWETSTLRTQTIPTILSQFPTELQSIIKTVKKTTDMYTSESTIEVTQDTLWLFTEEDVSTSSDYPYYASSDYGTSITKRTKKRLGDSSGSDWWLRDAIEQTVDDYPFYWKFVSESGIVVDDGESYYYAASLGVCLGFCI